MAPLSLSWLRSFVAVAQHGERKAAESLGVRASTVNKHIASLSEWLQGPALFEGRPLRLTDKGQAFLPIAQAAIQPLEDVLATLAESRANVETATPISDIPKISPLNIKLI